MTVLIALALSVSTDHCPRAPSTTTKPCQPAPGQRLSCLPLDLCVPCGLHVLLWPRACPAPIPQFCLSRAQPCGRAPSAPSACPCLFCTPRLFSWYKINRTRWKPRMGRKLPGLSLFLATWNLLPTVVTEHGKYKQELPCRVEGAGGAGPALPPHAVLGEGHLVLMSPHAPPFLSCPPPLHLGERVLATAPARWCPAMLNGSCLSLCIFRALPTGCPQDCLAALPRRLPVQSPRRAAGNTKAYVHLPGPAPRPLHQRPCWPCAQLSDTLVKVTRVLSLESLRLSCSGESYQNRVPTLFTR